MDMSRSGPSRPHRHDLAKAKRPETSSTGHYGQADQISAHLPEPPRLRLGGPVRDEHVHLPAAGCADLASRALGAPAVSVGDREVLWITLALLLG